VTTEPAAPRRLCLVTGASSGIGLAFAEVFAERGFNLVLTARREHRLSALAASLQDRFDVRAHVIPADLSTVTGVAGLTEAVTREGLHVDALVNNAGYGVPGPFTHPAWGQQEALLRVLIVALVELTYRLLPGMLERSYGRVINVASLAGLLPAPAGHTLYPAAKAFVIRFSEALAEEARGRGVHVTAVCPGFTLTEFHDVTGTRPRVQRLPAFMWLDARTVAEQGYDAVMRGDAVYVNGRLNRLFAAIGRHVPGVFTRVQRRFSWTFRER